MSDDIIKRAVDHANGRYELTGEDMAILHHIAHELSVARQTIIRWECAFPGHHIEHGQSVVTRKLDLTTTGGHP
jgi:hypothetical protein